LKLEQPKVKTELFLCTVGA